MNMVIHLCDYASQPYIRIKCSSKWTGPAWRATSEIEGVHFDEDGELYTFDEELVSCPRCIAKER